MKYKFIIILIIVSIISGCTGVRNENALQNKKNFFITIFDTDIDNPDKDRICYYMIYIDKIESGRTNTGLESQEKYFEDILQPNRHLIKIEKWVLNEHLGRYIKLNNIDQPKPDFIYINIEKNRITSVIVKSSRAGIASYSISDK